MAELVKDSVTGTLLDESDLNKMTQKIKMTMEDDTYYASLLSNIEKEKENILFLVVG